MDSERTFWSKKLKEIRSKKHLTQQQLADSLGISTKTLSHYEHTGKIRPSIKEKLEEMFPDELSDKQQYILNDSQLFDTFYNRLHEIFYSDQTFPSTYTPETIFLRVVSLYFSTRDWKNNEDIFFGEKILAGFCVTLFKTDMNTILSAIFPFTANKASKKYNKISIASYDQRTLYCLQNAVFLLTNSFYFQYRRVQLKKSLNTNFDYYENSTPHYSPDIPSILYHLRNINRYSLDDVSKMTQSFRKDLTNRIKELSNLRQTKDVQDEKEQLEYILSSLKTSSQSLKNYESGKTSPSIPLLEMLAWIYGFRDLSKLMRCDIELGCSSNPPHFTTDPKLPSKTPYSYLANAYIFLSILHLQFNHYHVPYSSLPCEFKLKPLYQKDSENAISSETTINTSNNFIPGSDFYKTLNEESTNLGIFGDVDDDDRSYPWTIRELSSVSGVSLSTLQRYYKFTSPVQPTIQKVLQVRNTLIKNPPSEHFLKYNIPFFFRLDELFHSQIEKGNSEFQEFFLFLQYSLYLFSNDLDGNLLNDLIHSFSDKACLAYYLPNYKGIDSVDLYIEVKKTASEAKEDNTKSYKDASIEVMAKKIAEILIQSSYLDKYLESYHIPESSKSSDSTDSNADMNRKKELMMDDIITSITDSYKNAAEFQNFLNQNPADSTDPLNLGDIPGLPDDDDTFETSDEDLEELDRLYQRIS
ncbi:helix-turn-helix transcriptional regulator [Negativibacillus massiliensis]|uniref:helix-turn-helix transcriptional regulator n=1 Tax=Negativibacillus massiliensis TaxID=1871035 RepID=UPI003AF26D17